MNVNPLSRAKVPKGTILFVDRAAAMGLSLCSSFSNLVPDIFAMICDLESDNVRGTIEKFVSVFEFEHLAILISGPLGKYLSVIKSMLGLGEFDIVLLMTTWPENDMSLLPKQLHRVFQTVDPFLFWFHSKFAMVPTIPPLLPDVIFDENSFNSNAMASVVSKVLKSQGECGHKFFAFGDYSRQVMDILDEGKSGEGNVGVLLIDRLSCATPLFVHNGSLLDMAASLGVPQGKTVLLKDQGMIDAELKGNTLKEVTTSLKVPPGSTIESIRQEWSKLSSVRQRNLLEKHPSLSLLLDRKHADLIQLENCILEGADLEEILESVALDVGKYLRLVAFAHMIEPVDIDRFVTAASEECGGGMSEVRSKEEQAAVLEMCSSGVKLGLGKTHRLRDLYVLPRLIQSILDKNMEVDTRIQGSGRGLLGSLFGKKNGLKECKKIFVFVFGGISFFEMKEINELLTKFRDIELKVFTDTLSSSIDLFSRL